MPKLKEDKTKVTLFPPQIMISPLTNRYQLLLTVKWGEFEKQLSISKEFSNVFDKAIEEINAALLEATELTQPYSIHD